MASSAATTVAQYLAELPPDRRAVVSRVRDVVRANMPAGYEEAMGWGMICWSIPLSRYPDTYNGQPLGYVALAAQKHYYALYLSVYMDAERSAAFVREFEAAGRTIDMGKSCVRFRSIDDLPLDVIGREVARVTPEQYIALYERSRASTANAPAKKAAGKQPTAKQAAAKQAAGKKVAGKKAAPAKAAATGTKRATKRA